jgi:hypothetical protein
MTTNTHLILIFDNKKSGRYNCEVGTMFRKSLQLNGFNRIKDHETGEYYEAVWSKPIDKEELSSEYDFIDSVIPDGVILSTFLATEEQFNNCIKRGIYCLGEA